MKLPDGWNLERLEKLVKFSSGGTPSKNRADFWDGEFPWVTAKDLKSLIIRESLDHLTNEGFASAKIAPEKSILILVRGMTLHKDVPVCLAGRQVAFNQDIKALVCSEAIQPMYLVLYLRFQKSQLLDLVDSAGHGTGRIDSDLLKAFPIRFPPLQKQKAIADLLLTWDEAIEKTERLIRAREKYCKNLSAASFGSDAVKEKKWPVVHLGELFSEVTRKVGEKKLTPFSISAGIGFVSQREKWGKDISGSQHKNYTHLKAGEFAYNKGNSKRYKQGCVYLLRDVEICVPNIFISFKPRSQEIEPEFYEHFFIADYHARELRKYITSGARADGLLNLNKSDFFRIRVPHPPLEDQRAIAGLLNSAKKEIDLLKQLAEKYKTQKRGLMQKLLTGQWRVKPEIINGYKEQ